jgi:thymidine phosphorylase
MTMAAIVEAQGSRGFDWRNPPLAPMTHEVAAASAGVVTAIDCERLSRIARLAGAPKAAGAGVDLLRKIGDPVASGEPLYRIHAETMAELHFAREVATRGSGFRIGAAAEAEAAASAAEF